MAFLVKIEDVRCLKETDKGLLCLIHGEEVWLPKSQVHADSEVYQAGDEGALVITRFIAEAKNLDHVGEEYYEGE